MVKDLRIKDLRMLKAKSSEKAKIITSLFFLVAGMFLSLHCTKRNEKTEKVPTYYGRRQEVAVRTIILQYGSNSNSKQVYINLPGIVVPKQSTFIQPKVSGKIVKMFVDVGYKVKRGQPLAKIDDRDYINFVERAKVEVERLKAQLKFAEISFRRAENLIATKSIPQSEFDSAKANYENIKEAYNSAVKTLEKAEIDLADTLVVAPFDGIIVEKRLDIGAFASPQTPIFLLQSENTYFVGKISERDLRNIKKAEEVQVFFPTLQKRYLGTIDRVKPSQDGRSYDLIVSFRESVPSNLQGIVSLPVSVLEGVYIPYESLIVTSDGEYVFSVSGNIAVKTKVDVIDQFGDYAVVKVPEGITEIISPVSERLYDGVKIKIIERRKIFED